ncbi:MAG TPA: haloacid dehalogenase type II [Candidatus Dormibacteraeota bacterium]|jgi:2-haloacid dehalogenase|nr:haloacid dehalogenase type II [Candidatus Dormibacteraeota bacterium]HYR73830.1 haloacid dehalogenase type II [Candidatus Acidoferrum sp.]
MDESAIGALTFDVFGTVVDWRTSVIREGQAFGKPRGLSVDWGKFADAWRGLYQPAMEEVRSGRRPWAKLDELHRESLVRLLGDFGIIGVSPAEIDHLNHAWHRLDPWPDAVPGLTRLKQRFTLATLSNGNIALMVDMAKRAGLPWDAILGAEVARAYKPTPEAYLRSAEALGLRPEQCLMVAAHPADLASAARCGLRTAYVPRPLEFGPGRPGSQPEPGQPFDVVAGDFVELAERLGC